MSKIHGNRILQVASYNIHECVGMDRRCDAARITEVIKELNCDIIGLQEVSSREGITHDSMQLQYLAQHTGMEAIAGNTLLRHTGEFGNAVLVRHPVRAVRRHDFSFLKREPRGALDIELDVRGVHVRVIATHLGLRPAERRFQVKHLLNLLVSTHPAPITIMLGDINEWLPIGRPLRWLHSSMGKPPACRSFPVWLPMFALDRVWVKPHKCLLDLAIHRSRLARIASDHYPIKAVISLDEAHDPMPVPRGSRKFLRRKRKDPLLVS